VGNIVIQEFFYPQPTPTQHVNKLPEEEELELEKVEEQPLVASN
jgi:hypothetical protein